MTFAERNERFLEHVNIHSNYMTADVLIHHPESDDIEYQATESVDRMDSFDVMWMKGEEEHIASLPHDGDDRAFYLWAMRLAEQANYNKEEFQSLILK